MTTYTLPSQGLSTLEKELTAATHIRQSSSNELSTPVSSNVEYVNKWKPMHYNSQTDISRLVAEWWDPKSNVKLGGFQSKLEASCVYSPTKELWFNKTI